MVLCDIALRLSHIFFLDETTNHLDMKSIDATLNDLFDDSNTSKSDKHISHKNNEEDNVTTITIATTFKISIKPIMKTNNNVKKQNYLKWDKKRIKN